uniref:Uncharacterized protein n=1 Tax=Arundo donax TaxID=35708 RepID=A0A0A9D0G7_ARUDO
MRDGKGCYRGWRRRGAPAPELPMLGKGRWIHWRSNREKRLARSDMARFIESESSNSSSMVAWPPGSPGLPPADDGSRGI